MTEQVLAAESTAAGSEPEPGPRGERRPGAAVVLVLLACLAAVAVLVMVVAPSAGAAGGCGGG
jgi:hypothetical protein